MKILRNFSGLVVLLFLLTPTNAEARSVVRIEDKLSIAQESVADGDLYAAAETAAVSGLVAGDLLVAAGDVTLSGKVASDTLAFAGAISISGEMGDDVRIVADTVTVTGVINGDLFVVARRLNILSDATISGDVLFFGQSGVIQGKVGNDVLGRMTELRLDGAVEGMVDVTVGTLTLGDRTVVAGDVRYGSATPITRAPGSVVSGSVVQSDGVMRSPFAYPTDVALGVLMLLFTVLSWYLLSRRTLERHATHSAQTIVRSGLLGSAVFFGVPFIILLLVLSQLGVLLALLVVAAYALLVLLAIVGMVPILGELFRRFVWRRGQFGLVWLLSGALVIGALLLVPAVAVFPLLMVLLISLGALSERLYSVLRP